MASKDLNVVQKENSLKMSKHCWFKQLANLLQISLLEYKGKSVNLNSSWVL